MKYNVIRFVLGLTALKTTVYIIIIVKPKLNIN